jgi:hypothetical protein
VSTPRRKLMLHLNTGAGLVRQEAYSDVPVSEFEADGPFWGFGLKDGTQIWVRTAAVVLVEEFDADVR